MHLTACVVTGRPEWTGWWAWNILKQTRMPDSLVVILDRKRITEEDLQALTTSPEFRVLSLTVPVKIVHSFDHKTLGELRNKALNAVPENADAITWFDDDDWHHPLRLSASLWKLDQGGLEVAFLNNAHRYVLDTDELLTLGEAEDNPEPSIPFSVFKADSALCEAFPHKNIGEDRAWLNLIEERVGSKAFECVQFSDIPTICIIHGANTWNRSDLPEYGMCREFAWSARPLPTEAPSGVPTREWATTREKLQHMRDVLKEKGEKREEEEEHEDAKN